jgi:hypothetical protein
LSAEDSSARRDLDRTEARFDPAAPLADPFTARARAPGSRSQDAEAPSAAGELHSPRLSHGAVVDGHRRSLHHRSALHDRRPEKHDRDDDGYEEKECWSHTEKDFAKPRDA